MAAARMHLAASRIAKKLTLSPPRFAGKGSFKETYETTTIDGVTVALKVFDAVRERPERTAREIAAMQACTSPSICRLYDNGRYVDSSGNETAYVVEEFLDGGTLTDRIAMGPLDTHQVFELGRHLSAALQHLQERGLVHRDVKPDNIMFRSGGDVPVLVDLGLVRVLSASSLTATWHARGPGTPFFASPEQLNNDKYLISWRSDQFSLGVVLWYCLSGEHPYQADGTDVDSAVGNVADRKMFPQEFAARCTKLGFEMLPRMVATWPIERFQSPEALQGQFAVA